MRDINYYNTPIQTTLKLLMTKYVWRSLLFFEITLISLICSVTAQVRFVDLDRLSLEEGLSQSSAICMLQDRQGFLWIGTEDGLNRYDGYSIKIFKADPADSGALQNAWITSLFEDHTGNLWVGTRGGLHRYDAARNKFISIPLDNTSLSVFAITEDLQHHLWVGTQQAGLFRKSASTADWRQYRFDPADPRSVSSNDIFVLYTDDIGRVWIGTRDNGLNRYDAMADNFIRYQPTTGNPYSISGLSIRSIRQYKTEIWIGTLNNGVNRLDPLTGRFNSYQPDASKPGSIAHNSIWSLFADSKGILWVGTFGNGVMQYDPAGDSFVQIQSKPSSTPRNDQVVVSILEDRSGMMWFGTIGDGLRKYLRIKDRFQFINAHPNPKRGLPDNMIWSLHEDRQSNIWISTQKGITVYNPKKEVFSQYTNPRREAWKLGETAYAMAQDSNGVIWFATFGDGLKRFDPRTQRISAFQVNKFSPGGIPTNNILALYVDHENVLWVGTYDAGLLRLEPGNRTFKVFKKKEKDSTSLQDNQVRTVFEDARGVLWVGTAQGGLHRFDRNSSTFKVYSTQSPGLKRLQNNFVSAVSEDKDGSLWVATYGGLHRMNRETETFICYSEKNGLASNQIYALIKDQRGRFWMTTSHGLSVLDPHDAVPVFRNYTSHHGLQSDEFNMGAAIRNVSGTIMAGGVSGVVIFHPDSLESKKYDVPVAITAVRVANRMLEHEPWDDKYTTLRHDQSTLAFEFASFDFSFPEQNKYAYRLEGFETEWSDADASRRTVNYTNLDPGKYVFQVRGTNSDGHWSDKTAAFRFEILPPFYKTWWFVGSSIFLIVFLAILFYRIRIRRIENQKNELARQITERTRELREKNSELERVNAIRNELLGMAVHDLRSPISAIRNLVQFHLEALKNQINDRETDMHDMERALSLSDRISSTLNDLLDISAIESGKLSINKLPENIETIIHDAFELNLRAAERKGTTLKSDIAPNLPKILVDRIRIADVLNNLISNAVKYTPKNGRIRVYAEVSGMFMHIHVEDNGQGLTQEDLSSAFKTFTRLSATPTDGETSTGLGLAIVKKIVELHGGSVWVRSEKNKGSTFSFSVSLEGHH